MELAASEVNPGLTGQNSREPVVLQGAVDCVFEENGGLILVDYKTDYVKEEQELKNRYRRQLSLYALALEQTTGLKVTVLNSRTARRAHRTAVSTRLCVRG